MFCLEPLVLAGYMFMADPNRQFHKGKAADLQGTVMELQSCDRGLGLDMKASTSGVYGIALQYGFQLTHNDLSFTLTPKLGVAYHDVEVYEEQSKGTFNVGVQAMFGYKNFRAGAEWFHMSNAGLGDRNYGLDTVVMTCGWKFETGLKF